MHRAQHWHSHVYMCKCICTSCDVQEMYEKVRSSTPVPVPGGPGPKTSSLLTNIKTKGRACDHGRAQQPSLRLRHTSMWNAPACQPWCGDVACRAGLAASGRNYCCDQIQCSTCGAEQACYKPPPPPMPPRPPPLPPSNPAPPAPPPDT